MLPLRGLFVIACCALAGCGSSAKSPASDGSAGDGSAGLDGLAVDGPAGGDVQTSPDSSASDARQTSDGRVAVCSDVPYPMSLMCSVPMEICLPTSGYDCCRCLPGHGCGADYVWRCQNSFAGCP